MGAGTSKPEQPKDHVFTASTPIRLSPQLDQSLSNTPESNTTRSSTSDLTLQKRVTTELEKLESSISSSLSAKYADLAKDPPSSTVPVPESDGPAGADAYSIKSAKDEKLEKLSRAGVQKEIEALKTKLAERKVRGEGEEVKKRKEALVQCLRVNDRRPLDCWEEVEGFKTAVGRLEEGFLRGVREG